MAVTIDGTNGITSPDFEPSSSTTPTNGLFLPAANTVGLATGSTERLRIDSSGNLGLGVTPSGWGSSYKALEIGGTVSYLSAASQYLAVYANAYRNSFGTNVYTTSGVATAYVQDLGAHKWYTAPSGTAGAAITFTQAMTLDASGNLLVGCTSVGADNSRLTLSNDAGTTKWEVGPYSSYFNQFIILAAGSTGGVYLPSTSATSWASASDERLKTDLKPIDNAVKKVSTLRAVTGRFKADKEGMSRAFLIAQDVLAVLPEAVDASNPDKLGVAYTDTIPLLVAAIKELTARLEALENK